jgi:hypothetical protein
MWMSCSNILPDKSRIESLINSPFSNNPLWINRKLAIPDCIWKANLDLLRVTTVNVDYDQNYQVSKLFIRS